MKKRSFIILVVIASLVGSVFVLRPASEGREEKRVALVIPSEGLLREAIAHTELETVAEGEFAGYDVAVRVDLLDYQKNSDHLAVKARLAYLDLSQDVPRLLAERVINWSHPLPEADHLIDYNTLSQTDYLHTPLAVAHSRLGTDLSQMITSSLP